MEDVGSNGYLEDDTIVDIPDSRTLVNRGSGGSRAPFEGGDPLAHCHPSVSPPQDSATIRTLSIVALMTFAFIVLEFTGAQLADSLALRTDAAHMLSDFFSFLISIFSVYVARLPASKTFSFGWYRAEILGAMVSILIIWALTAVLVYLAYLRCWDLSWTIEVDYMLGTAVCGVVFNILYPHPPPIPPRTMGMLRMGAVLHFCGNGHGHSHGLPGSGHGHSHGGHSHGGHGHSHSQGAEAGARAVPGRRTRRISVTAYPTEEVVHVNKTRNINVHAAFVHVLGDLVQSIGVLIAALIIKFAGEDYKLADPICTFVFSILVIITTLTVLRDALRVLMEGVPRDVDYHSVRGDLEQILGVKSAHSLHMWSLTMDKAALAVHLAIDTGVDAVEVQRKASRIMRYKYNVFFTTVQVEPWDPVVMKACPTCIGPLA